MKYVMSPETVQLDVGGCFKSHKWYPIFNETEGSFNVIGEDGLKHFCLWHDCAHLNRGSWLVREDKDEGETKMTAIPFTTTDNSVSVFLNGKMMVVNSNDPGYRGLYDHLNKNETHDVALVEQLVDKKAAIMKMSDGDVTIEGDTVFYRGDEVHGS